MKKAALLLLAILTTAGMYAHTPENPAAKPKIKGSYAMDIDSPYGLIKGTMVITKVKKEYAVTLQENKDNAVLLECTNVVVDGAKISFTFFTEGMDIAMALEIDGDTVTGTMMSQYTVKGTRIE